MRYIFLVILMATSLLHAQIHFENLTTRNGLSQNSVLAIAQDSLGFMWFGTSGNGLNRYDGKTFTYFTHKKDDVNSLSSNHINKLLAVSDGSLWIGTDSGLDYYNAFNSSITKASYKTPNGVIYSFDRLQIFSLKKEPNGMIWALTSSGLYFKNPDDSFFEQCNIPLTSTILALEPLSSGMYLISAGGFIYTFDKERNSVQKNDLIDYNKISNINTIFKDTSGNLFFGSYGNGFAISLNNKSNIKYYNKGMPIELKNGVIRSFCEDKNGEIYIGTFNGLYVLNLKTDELKGYFSNDKENTGLSHNSVHSIVADVAGNVWIGTFSGGVNIEYATNYAFKTYGYSTNLKNTLPSNIVNTFFEDDYGIWIGTDGSGLSLLVDEKFKNFENAGLSSHIKTIFKKDANHIWLGSHDLGSYDFGLILFNQQTGSVEKQLLKDYSIYGIQKGKRGPLWLASIDAGLLFFNENTLQLENNLIIPNGLKRRVRVIHYSKERDAMFICSVNSIFMYNFSLNKFFELTKKSIRDSIYEINDLLIDSTGNILLGTSNGLLKITNLNLENGDCDMQLFPLDNLNIKSLKEATDNTLWVSSFSGLSSISKDFSQIRTYDQQYKIQGNEFINKASYRSKDHILWFGGNEGFTTFDPSKLDKNTYVPPLLFTKIAIDNEEYIPIDASNSGIDNIAFKKSIDLEYWQKNITLEVAALNYIIPNKNNYQWELLSDDQSIIEGTGSVIHINNLLPGSYKLSVLASNNDGVWVNAPLELDINITPPWWKSNGAYFIYLILGIIIVLVSNKIYIERKTILSALELEKMEKSKEKELQEEKLTFFTNVSHEIRTPLTLISGPISHALSLSDNNEINENLLIAEKNTNYLKELIDQLLDFRKVEKNVQKLKLFRTDINAFIKNICNSFNNPSDNNKTLIDFDSSIDSTVFIDRDVVNKIVRNLISNAIKYNKEKQPILVTLSEKHLRPNPLLKNSFSVGSIDKRAKKIYLAVEDSGIGITENSLPKIFKRFFQINDYENKHIGSGIGLSLVKSLVLLHKGKIKVESERNQGTRFTVILPVNKEFYKLNDFVPNVEATDTTKINETIKDEPFQIKEETDHNKPTVLLVDDNQELLHWMVSFLSKKFNCLTAEHGKKGFSIAKKMNPDIIVSDVMMPKMDGFELCKILKNEIKTSHIPIILLTAKTFQDDEREGFISGTNSYIKKPFHPEVLISTIENFIDLKNNIVEKYNANYKDSSLIEKLSVYDRKIIDMANNYIESNIADTSINVENMATALAMSRSSLFRKIKAITNTSPNEYIKNYRLNIALEMIKEKEYTINEISEMVGFYDFYYFRKCFIQKFGVKPEQV